MTINLTFSFFSNGTNSRNLYNLGKLASFEELNIGSFYFPGYNCSSLLLFSFPDGLLWEEKLHFAGGKELELAAIITGIGYMLIEIPVIVQLEMIIGFPIYTFALVLTILLVFSGLGSRYVEKIRSNRFFLKMVFVHPLIILGFSFINYLRNWLLELPGVLSLLVVFPFSIVAL